MIDYKTNDLMMFVDAIGHIAMATFVEKIDVNRIRIKNPLWVSLVPRHMENGEVRIMLETPAWAFRDLLADHNDPQYWDILVDKYSFYEGTAFSDMIKLHYYNSFARINNGVRDNLDENGNKMDIPVPPPPADNAESTDEAKKSEDEPKESPDLD